jgi:cytoskeletal protein RodZ
MALNKLEKEFKNQLDQREIKPSPAAWDRLDAMLTVREEKKVKPIYNWIYIAASIIGFLAIGYVFFSNPAELVDVKRTEVVENNVSNPTIDSINKEPQTPIQIQKEIELIADNQVATQKKNAAISTSQKINKQINVPQKQIAQTSNTNKNTVEQQIEKSIHNQKANEFNQISPNPITNKSQIAEVTAKTNNPTVKVNASNLLSEVDNELELSFREKVIRKIDKNYKTVKVALANRNQQ